MGIEQGHLSQLQHQGGSATVIPLGNQFLSRQADQFSDPAVHFDLQRVVLLEIGLDRPAHLSAGGQEGSVLAGTIVLKGTVSPIRHRALK